MKRLFILRHAKAAFNSPSGLDVDRPLTESGKQTAQKLGYKLKGRNEQIDRVWISPAVRTQQTGLFLSATAALDTDTLFTIDWLYQTNVEELLSNIHQLPNELKSILIIGHNPTLTQVCNALINELNIDNLPTCGIIEIIFKCKNWSEIHSKNGQVVWFDFPKLDN